MLIIEVYLKNSSSNGSVRLIARTIRVYVPVRMLSSVTMVCIVDRVLSGNDSSCWYSIEYCFRFFFFAVTQVRYKQVKTGSFSFLVCFSSRCLAHGMNENSLNRYERVLFA
jgi:hypothetical protein